MIPFTAAHLTTIQLITVCILPVLFAITVHEVAHGYVAYLLGDKTAKILGRLTLNPVKHIDLIGTIIVPIILLALGNVIIGWAKPVPINARNLAKPKRDLALIAVAGPSVNFVMALIWAGIAKIATYLYIINFPGSLAIFYMGEVGILINLMLMVLNLLPVPPLDGGHVLLGLLPRTLAMKFERIAPYGLIILLLLLAIGAINFIVTPIVAILTTLISAVFNFPI